MNSETGGNAERLVAQKGADIRYCQLHGEWLVWRGTQWKADYTGEIERMAKKTVRSIYEEAAETADRDRRKKLEKHAADSEKAPRIAAMINLARSEQGISILPEQLDRNDMLLNVLNGTFDLENWRFYPHKREELITKIANVRYDPDAECPIWRQFLFRITNGSEGLIGFLQRLAGYCLCGDTSEQCVFLLHGSGNNGKSVVVRTFQSVLGDYALQADLSTFLLKSGETRRNDLARLKGARLVSAVEAEENRKLNEVLVKQVTGGEDIVARFLYQEPFQFKPTFKICLVANYEPTITGAGSAIWRRIFKIPFSVSISENERDRHFQEKRLQPEAAGILNWMLEGFDDWQNGGLKPPKEVLEATQKYRKEMDVLGFFISEMCNGHGKSLLKDLYARYMRRCERTGEEPLSYRKFSKKLQERGIEAKTGTGGLTVMHGISLRDEVP